MGVLAIWRYPVKAMLGELLEAVEVGSGGCEGDRRWVVTDLDTGERIANKRGPTDPALRACRAQLLDDAGPAPPLKVTLPDGTEVVGGEIEAALSDLLGRRVLLAEFEGDGAGALGVPAVVPTRAQDDMPRDPTTLRTITRHHLIDVGSHGRYACAGAYAEAA